MYQVRPIVYLEIWIYNFRKPLACFSLKCSDYFCFLRLKEGAAQIDIGKLFTLLV